MQEGTGNAESLLDGAIDDFRVYARALTETSYARSSVTRHPAYRNRRQQGLRGVEPVEGHCDPRERLESVRSLGLLLWSNVEGNGDKVTMAERTPEAGSATTRLGRLGATTFEPTASESGSGGALGGATITPEHALHVDEVRRLRVFAGFLGGMCVTGAAMIAALGGDRFARHVHIAAIGATGVAAILYFILVRDVARYRSRYIAALVVIASVTNATGFYYWGVLSGYAAMVTVSAYVVAVTGGRSAAIAGFVITLGGHISISAATVAGWLDDRALVSMARLSVLDQIVALVLLDLVIIAAMVLGFQTRKAARASFVESLGAMRDLARREAQLAEVRAEMRDAHAAAGRFTDQVIGRFRIGELLGRGTMGEVYDATGVSDHAPYAIKLLSAHLASNPDARQRFQRELRVVTTLVSPHIVRIVDVSPPAALLPYLVMERLDGIDLATWIKDEPIRPLPEVVEMIRQLASALDAAHAAGVVHRDLKPQNVMGVGPADARTWKVLDFGIAKLIDSGGTLTRDQVVGTPGYMSPEQARGDHVDARTDVYALGILAYRLLTGLPAVMPGEVHAMLYQVVHRMPPRPSSLVALPVMVEAVLAVVLAKQPGERFDTAGKFAAALAEAAAGHHDAELAARATKILARTPWGHWARQSSYRGTTTG